LRANKAHLGCGISSRISTLQVIFCSKKQEKSAAENVKCFTGSLQKAKVLMKKLMQCPDKITCLQAVKACMVAGQVSALANVGFNAG